MRFLIKISLALIAALFVLVLLAWYLVSIPETDPPVLGGALETHSFEFNGRPRSFIYYVPGQLPADASVVIVLHGSRGDGRRIRNATAFRFDVLADEYGFLVVYPNGFENHWNDCRAAGSYSAKQLNIDDPGFMRALLAFLEKEHAVNLGEVFVIGLSNGGQMSYRLAFETPELIRAAVAIAANLPGDDNLDCEPSGRGLPVMVINGTDDPINPYDGGEVTLLGPFGSRGQVRSSMDTAKYWAELAGYDAEPFQHRYPDVETADGSVATRMVWSAPDRPEISLITVHGGGHTIPSPAARFPRFLGPSNRDFSAADEAWRFFERELGRSR